MERKLNNGLKRERSRTWVFSFFIILMKGETEMVLNQFISMAVRSSRVACSFATKNSNALLATLGLTTLGGTVISLFKAVPDCMDELDRLKEDLKIAKDEETAKKLKRAAKKKVAIILAVPALMTFICAFSIIGNAYINNKKLAALAAAYALSEQKIDDLEQAAKEIAGGKKAALIEDEASKKDVERRGSRNEEDVISTGHGDDLFWEPKTGHWLRANRDFVLLAFSDIRTAVDGTEIISGDRQTVNDLFERLKLPTDTEFGQWFGWDPGDHVGCNLVNTGKHYWDNGKDDYYTVIDYTAKFLGREGHRV